MTARRATLGDVPELERLYRLLEEEMTVLSPMWPVADGLAEPTVEALTQAVGDDTTEVLMGEIDGCTFAFLVARVEPMLPQAEGETIGVIRFVFVEQEAREVGVGETIRDLALRLLRQRGIRRFDAHVLPGHRLAKNFFEAGGFAARSIVMHRPRP